jgi:2,3-bisphosphoglycerate-independent phosphoglycerate mutase
MKYITLLCDGMADVPVPALHGKTPMEAACKPHMDRLFKTALVGLAKTVPDSLPAGSDVANLSVFGYEPTAHYTGRSPLEAISMGLSMRDDDTALRCNLVTLGGSGPLKCRFMEDYSAGEITTEESRELMSAVATALDSDIWRFHPGISYRHCMLWQGGPLDISLTPPHDISGRPVADWLPSGPGSEEVLSLMERALPILADHPVNLARKSRNLNPGNAVWLWGQGTRPALPSFAETFGMRGSVISAVDLIKGIGIAAGMASIDVVGVTGNLHTNYRGKAEAALRELSGGSDFVYIHVEAPDECGHQGQAREKTTAIERIDAELLSVLLEKLPSLGDFRMLILPDHPTPVGIRTHTRTPVPFLLYDSRKDMAKPGQGACFTETLSDTGLYVPEAHKLMTRLLEQD